ncbi:hypothetical protein Ga0080559_TMP3242 [Salipiger profundus]|uniref:Uncharacterized protein n=1 Tax=Salipiger profundus TaxID=1229727 RepID=A0A1U7D7F2_9RHOB|nr:hypothetical protein Ga0080559_TMP3242 [Salipiger profundus]
MRPRPVGVRGKRASRPCGSLARVRRGLGLHGRLPRQLAVASRTLRDGEPEVATLMCRNGSGPGRACPLTRLAHAAAQRYRVR